MGFLGTLFGGEAEADAADKNKLLYQGYGNTGQQYLKDTYGQGRTDLGQAVGAYAPLAQLGQQYNQGGNAMMDALGVNGPGGYERAMQNFHAGPGFNFARDQALQAVDRRRAGGSMGQSGNADLDTINAVEGISNQEFQNYLKNLSGVAGMGLQATGAAAQGQAAGYGGLAGLASQYGQNQTNLLGNVVSGTANANNTEAAGQAAGAKNLLGFGTQVASMMLGIPGGGMGGGGGGGTALAGGGYNFSNSPLGSLFKTG